MPSPLTFETLTAIFLALLGLAAPFTRAPRPRRASAAALAVVLAAAAYASSNLLTTDVRLWMGHLYLACGYWIPGLMASPGASPGFEAWLVRADALCRRVVPTLWPWLIALLEVSYLLCYVLVPIAFVVVWRSGTIADVDRFWTAVLLGGFACYGTLPWLTSRPPRVLEHGVAIKSRVRGVNEFVLARVSHGLNTFPSGHVAVSVAAALEVLRFSPAVGAAMLLVALAIAAGAYTGRYHYAADVLIGFIAGVVAAALI